MAACLPAAFTLDFAMVAGLAGLAAFPTSEEEVLSQQADLVRHIVGNPFRSPKMPQTWPSDVTHLAAALYEGDDCAFALADALEEAGLSEWAAHFRQPDHPKGCWALDAILGKS